MHSLRARSDLLISEDSVRRWRLWDLVSEPRSDPARSTRESLPLRRPVSEERRRIWQMAWEREEVSLASVAWVVRLRFPASTRVRKSDGFEA